MPETVDVVIVGGGISGLYAAWRLAAANQDLTVRLYEADTRLGGRLETLQIPQSSTSVELGAMRLPPAHEMTVALLKTLNINTQLFPAQTFQHMYLRSETIGLSTGTDGRPTTVGNVPYRLRGTEPNHPHLLLLTGLRRILPTNIRLQSPSATSKGGWMQVAPDGTQTPVTTADWDQILSNIQVDGRELWKWGFWNLLERVLSNEAYHYLLDGFGVESAVSNWNGTLAVRLLVTIMIDSMTNGLVHPVGGWTSLVNAVIDQIGRLSNCSVHTGTEVVRVTTPKDGGLFEVHFRDGSSVLAKKLIGALTGRGYERIDWDVLGTERQQKFVDDLRNVSRIPASKVYLLFKDPWWISFCGWVDGYVVSDQPVRQVFYGIGIGGQPADSSRVLMTSYADGAAVDFWGGLLGDGERVREVLVNTTGPHPMIQSVRRQLVELHGLESDFPELVWGCIVDWARDPYGAGWHAWNPGVDTSKEIPRMRKPFPELDLYLCGEAFSHIQGWVEGALTATEMVLEEHFGLTRPAWIPADYPLGPQTAAACASSTTR